MLSDTMIAFKLVVTPEFWDGPRGWPEGCRPIVFSTELVMRNAGVVHVPEPFLAEASRMLRDHPHVLSVAPLVTGHGRGAAGKRRSAA